MALIRLAHYFGLKMSRSLVMELLKADTKAGSSVEVGLL